MASLFYEACFHIFKLVKRAEVKDGERGWGLGVGVDVHYIFSTGLMYAKFISSVFKMASINHWGQM